MKVIRFALVAAITLSVVIFLNFPYGNIPALGKLLSPKHGFWQNAEIGAITAPSNIELEGIRGKVSIYFDQQLIPHIYAQNDEDLFFAQGYVTAFHRLWQMEFQTFATAGRMSELFGDRALNYDRTQRRKGLTYAAQRGLEELKKDSISYAYIQAYTRGVNAYIKSLGYGELPIEYKLLDYRPEPWTEFKCLLVIKEMSDMLSRREEDLQNTNALKIWGKENFDILFPETHPGIDPVIPVGTKFDFTPIPTEKPPVEFPLVLTENLIASPSKFNGSNSFVVNSKKTEDGSVLFSNEMDLSLNLPCIWYMAHLNSPNYNVIGATLPGVPTVIVGYNDSIAWGKTNAKRDLADWYKITFRNDRREEYKYDNKWLKTQKIIETIKVKGGGTFYDTLIYTHYGPVVYDRNFTVNQEMTDMALRWPAHEASKEFKAFFMLNKANNYQEFSAAYEHFTGPPVNVSFASAQGDIAIRIVGKFPVKWEGQGKFLMDGSDSRFEWKTFMPYEHTYETLNPTRNFVSSANQHPGDSTYPYYDYDAYFEYFRNRRINDRLKVMSAISEKDMMELQHDNFNYIASEILPVLLDSMARDSSYLDAEQTSFLDDLREWDYFNNAERRMPTVFELWWDNLFELLWDEFEGQPVSLVKPTVYNTIYILKNYPDFQFIDLQSTPRKETTGDLFQMAFDKALEELKAWQETHGDDFAWYRFKNTSIRHLLPPLEPFSITGVRVGGNHNIVNAIGERAGPTIRLIVKLKESGNEGWAVYPGSQTGNPGNPTYGGMVNAWAKGDYYALPFTKTPPSTDETTIFQMTLNPLQP